MPIKMYNIKFDEDVILEVMNVLKSGKVVQGENVNKFEEEFAKYVDADYAVAVNSGTTALMLACELIGLEIIGRRAAVPNFTHIATAVAPFDNGYVLDFIDVDGTMTMDMEAVKNNGSNLVVPTHLYGNVTNPDDIIELRREDRRIVCDAAQATGSRYLGQGIGALGDLNCFSFYPTKNLGLAEGGMITTDDESLAEMCRLKRSQGQVKKYEHEIVGYNYRMNELVAVMGLRKLKKLDKKIERQQKNAKYYRNRLNGIVGMQYVEDGVEHSYNNFPVVTPKRDNIIKEFEENKIEYGIHYPKICTEQTIFSWYPLKGFENAKYLAKSVLCIPVHDRLGRDDLKRVCEAIEDAIEN